MGDVDGGVNESMAPNPQSIYGASKLVKAFALPLRVLSIYQLYLSDFQIYMENTLSIKPVR